MELECIFFETIKSGLIGCSGMSSTQLSRWIISLVSPKNREAGSSHLDDPLPLDLFLLLWAPEASGFALQIQPLLAAAPPNPTSDTRWGPQSYSPQGPGDVSPCPPRRSQRCFYGCKPHLDKAWGWGRLEEERKTAPWDYVTEQKGNNLGSQIVRTHRSVTVHWYQTEGLGGRQAFPALSWMTFLQPHNPASVWFTGSLKINRGQRCDKRPVIDRCWFPRLV